MSREEGARAAREELSDPVYGDAEPSLIERVYLWVANWLEELAQQAQQAVPGGWWVLGPLLGAFALLAAALILYVRPARRSRRAAVLDTAAELTADHHRDLAAQYAAEGQYSEAIRERLRAVSRSLEERALITPRPGRTATELAAEGSAVLPDQRAALYRAAALFNDVWYGDRAATAEGYGLLCALDDALRSAVPALSAEAAP